MLYNKAVRSVTRACCHFTHKGKLVCIISLREESWTHKSRLTPTMFIEVPVQSQGSDRSCICVLGVSVMSLSTNFRLDNGIYNFFVQYIKNRSTALDTLHILILAKNIEISMLQALHILINYIVLLSDKSYLM